jgi:hypothetical protein
VGEGVKLRHEDGMCGSIRCGVGLLLETPVSLTFCLHHWAQREVQET